MTDWTANLKAAQKAAGELSTSLAELTELREKAVADIAAFLRVDSGIELDVDAIQATITRPYTIVPISEYEAWLIHWRGIKMPVFGWVVAAEPAFLKAKVTRSMDLLTPLPLWMKEELGWKPPQHGATIDGTRTAIQLTEGDEGSFKRRYGKFLGGKQEDGAFKIKGGDSWIKLVASLVRDGILPYSPTPVAPEHWGPAHPSEKLLQLVKRQETRANDHYINRAVNEFHEKGAVLVNYPPGAGKTLVAACILDRFKGRVLLLADSTLLIQQWEQRLPDLVTEGEAEVTVSTYQGASKYLDQEWDLLIADEAQRLPANTFSKLAFVKTKYRLGLTAHPGARTIAST